MKKNLVLAGIALMSGNALAAQEANCPPGNQPPTISGQLQNAVHDACVQAVDVYQFFSPQLGLALTGGNATMGQGGTLGGLGHFAIGLRANAFSGNLPQVNQFQAPRTSASQPGQILPSKDQYVGLPVVDVAIGLFQGIPVGVTNVGGIDLLVNAAYVPSLGGVNDDIRITPESNYKFGFGARVGVLQESFVVPGVGVTYIRRDLPTTTIQGTSNFVDLTVDKLKVNTSAWRVVANKNFVGFGVAVGYGQDTYDQSTSVSGTVKSIATPAGMASQAFGPIAMAQSVTRSNMFADLSLNMSVVKLVGEVGQVSGGTFSAPTNTFANGKLDDTRTYASLGLRFGW